MARHARPKAQVFDVSMAAAYAYTSYRSIMRAINEGQLPAHVFEGSSLLKIHRAELDAWIKSQPLYKPKALY